MEDYTKETTCFGGNNNSPLHQGFSNFFFCFVIQLNVSEIEVPYHRVIVQLIVLFQKKR